MNIVLDEDKLMELIERVLDKRGYFQEKEDLTGKTIGLKEFTKKYCAPHGVDWVKDRILYEFEPSWVADLNPGRGGVFTIFEKEAAQWLEDHRDEIEWV